MRRGYGGLPLSGGPGSGDERGHGVVQVGERIADALIGRGGNSAAGGQGDAQCQRGEGGPALRPAPRGKLVAG
jgi:hypothetical protein